MATYRNIQSDEEVINIPDSAYSSTFSSNIPDLPSKEFYGQNELSGQLHEEKSQNVSSLVWEVGKEQAKKTYNLYANIDILRPFFNVEPTVVRQRIIESLVPRFPGRHPATVLPTELYGPLMLVFTEIALLLFGMKTSGHVVKEGTLMGTAFGVCFGYWLGAASLAYTVAYICNTQITFLQVLSLIGYALSGHCLTLFLGTSFHPADSHFFFYLIWCIIGGLTAAKLVFVMMERTPGKSQRLLVCCTVALVHLLYLLYLHFAYHKTVEG